MHFGKVMKILVGAAEDMQWDAMFKVFLDIWMETRY